MKGECIITLTGSEVEMAIAKLFEVEQEDVRLSVGHTTVGCGPMEREEHHVIAKINMPFKLEKDTIQFGRPNVPSI